MYDAFLPQKEPNAPLIFLGKIAYIFIKHSRRLRRTICMLDPVCLANNVCLLIISVK